MNIIQLLNEKSNICLDNGFEDKSEEMQFIDSQFGITPTINLLSQKIINKLTIFSNRSKTNESLIIESAGCRDAVKAYILSAMLAVPSELGQVTVDNAMKKRLIDFFIKEKQSLKIAPSKSGKKEELKKKNFFIDKVNYYIDEVITKQRLDKIIIVNKALSNVYIKVTQAILENVSDDLVKAFPRLVSSPLEKKAHEVVSIEQIVGGLEIPVFSDKSKVEDKNKTYILRHPRGSGKFPDFVMYLGNDIAAKEIERKYGITSKKVYIEGKAGSIVGKQKTSASFKRSLKNDDLYHKLMDVKIGKDVFINGNELKELLHKGLGVYLTQPTMYVDLGKKKSPVKILDLTKKPELLLDNKYRVNRSSAGHFTVYKDKTKLFSIEAGSGSELNTRNIEKRKTQFKENFKDYLQQLAEG